MYFVSQLHNPGVGALNNHSFLPSLQYSRISNNCTGTLICFVPKSSLPLICRDYSQHFFRYGKRQKYSISTQSSIVFLRWQTNLDFKVSNVVMQFSFALSFFLGFLAHKNMWEQKDVQEQNSIFSWSFTPCTPWCVKCYLETQFSMQKRQSLKVLRTIPGYDTVKLFFFASFPCPFFSTCRMIYFHAKKKHYLKSLLASNIENIWYVINFCLI